MANTLARFKKYTDKLDEVYQHASVTAVLDGDGSLVQMGANAGEMIIPKISMDGLADYSRSGGYVAGDVTLTNETRPGFHCRRDGRRGNGWHCVWTAGGRICTYQSGTGNGCVPLCGVCVSQRH